MGAMAKKDYEERMVEISKHVIDLVTDDEGWRSQVAKRRRSGGEETEKRRVSPFGEKCHLLPLDGKRRVSVSFLGPVLR